MLGSELSEETPQAERARVCIGKGCLGEELQGKGAQETCAPHGSVLGFMAMGLVSRLSVASHSDSGYFLVACTSLHRDKIPVRRILEG